VYQLSRKGMFRYFYDENRRLKLRVTKKGDIPGTEMSPFITNSSGGLNRGTRRFRRVQFGRVRHRPLRQSADRFSQGLSQRGRPILHAGRDLGEDLPLHQPPRLELAEGPGELLLRYPPHRLLKLPKPDRPVRLVQVEQHRQRPAARKEVEQPRDGTVLAAVGIHRATIALSGAYLHPDTVGCIISVGKIPAGLVRQIGKVVKNTMRGFGYQYFSGAPAIGLLILRFVFGLGLVLHGLPKIQNPTGWMGPNGMPGFLQFAAALAEFGGGIALILGLLTPLAAVGIAITMAVAILTAHAGDPFISPTGGKSFELAALYLASALGLLFVGPGALSLDAAIFGRRKEILDNARDAVTVRKVTT
jgi:putative oxidoreductase